MMELNRAKETNAHSSYCILRFLIIYITNMKLRHLGAVILIEPHITRFYDFPNGRQISRSVRHLRN